MRCLKVLRQGCLPERICERVVRVCLGRRDSREEIGGGGAWRILLEGVFRRAVWVSSVCMCDVSVLDAGAVGRELRIAV